MKGKNLWSTLKRPPWRTVSVGVGLLLALWVAYGLWSPGLDIRDGRHDRGRNGIWLSHGWLGADEWFVRNSKTNEFTRYRDATLVQELAAKLRRHHITDVFPHLCPAEPDGRLPAVDEAQTERFLDALEGFRVMPWVGGPNGGNVRLLDAKWRAAFANQVDSLLKRHPRLTGIHLNVEPLRDGDANFLLLLEELRAVIPPGKLISVAAYPPPTRWHPYPDLHWGEKYLGEVARRCDQVVVMMYDAGQRIPKTYQRLMADWTRDVLAWSSKSVLLGVPTYDDAGVGYHRPHVKNLTNALLGVHRGLASRPLPENYQGVALYCDWETTEAEWGYFREHFLKAAGPRP
jgi:hypothetical protein